MNTLNIPPDKQLTMTGIPPTKAPGGDSGNVKFSPGRGAVETDDFGPGKHGSIIFMAGDHTTELMKITGYGEFFVNGKKVADDFDAYSGFISWLRTFVEFRHYIDQCVLVDERK